MRARVAVVVALALLATAAAACFRRSRAPETLPPLHGDAVWFSDGIGADDPGIEETLRRFHCAAVFVPARRLHSDGTGWSGSDLPMPPRPLTSAPVVLVLGAAGDPLAGADEKRGKAFGGILANEITAALARRSSFGRVRGIHLDIPFSGASAEAHAAALTEARSRLSHLLARGDAAAEAARTLPITLSMWNPAPANEKEEKAVRALASRTDGIVAFVFGEKREADPVFVDSLSKPWWAAYESATRGSLKRSSGEPGPALPESALDPLTDDPRTELLHELPWNEKRGTEVTLRATRGAAVAGAALAPGESATFSQPSIADLLAKFRSDTSGRRFAQGRIVIFGAGDDRGRLFPVAALADVLAGNRAVPQLHGWAAEESSRYVRVGAENATPHASVASRVENWIEVELSPARVEDVELGGFDRWEAYNESGRAVSPGRATRVRLYETLVAPFEKFAPARLRMRGRAPAGCCRVRTHLVAATGGEVGTGWVTGTVGDGAMPTPSP